MALIYVGWTGNAWKCTGIGSAGIAGEMSEILRTYPESDGYTHRFIRIYEAKSDFVCLSRHQNRKDVPGYLPLLSARIALDINHGDETGKQLIYEDEFIDPLRSIVRKASGRSQ